MACSRLVALASATILLGVACSGSPTRMPRATTRNTGSPIGRVLVTRHDPTLPPSCRPIAVAKLISSFFEALESPGEVAIDRYFAPIPKFRWYSVTEGRGRDDTWKPIPTYDRSELFLGPGGRGRHFVTYDRASLGKYLVDRQAQRERMELRTLQLRWQLGPPHPEAAIVYVLERAADDLEAIGVADGLAFGKGAIDCESGKIFVWSMGMEEPPASQAAEVRKTLCPAPTSASTEALVVACTAARG
jgi:hypothetical protein